MHIHCRQELKLVLKHMTWHVPSYVPEYVPSYVPEYVPRHVLLAAAHYLLAHAVLMT